MQVGKVGMQVCPDFCNPSSSGMQVCKDSQKRIKSKILYYTLFVYPVVPMRRKWQYLDLRLLGGNQLTYL